MTLPRPRATRAPRVHRIAKDHHKPGSGTADDFLDPALTTQELVNAVGWLADNFKGDWGFSVINTGHHDDPRAHARRRDPVDPSGDVSRGRGASVPESD